MTPPTLRHALLRARQSVFTASLPAFDETARSFIAELPSRPTETGTLLAEAAELIRFYQTDPRAAHLPPMLCREVWEPAEDYTERMYRRGGYRQ
jgi:hypothetical protein